jgi:hypothetical protein
VAIEAIKEQSRLSELSSRYELGERIFGKVVFQGCHVTKQFDDDVRRFNKVIT